MSPSGSLLWMSTFGVAGNDAANSCLELPNGSFIVAGNSGNNNIRLTAVNAIGDSVTSRGYSSGGGTAAYDITMLHDGNFAVVGYGLGSDGLHSDLWLLKCDQNLDTLWTRKFGGDDVDNGYRIEEQPDFSLLIAGSTKSDGAIGSDFWLLRTDVDGNLLSSSTYGGAGQDYCYDFVDGDSILYLCGKSTQSGSNAGFLTRVSSGGDSLFAQSYMHAGVEDQLRGTIARGSGSAVCAGWSGSSWNARQFWMLEVNPDGTEAWQWAFGPAGSGFYGILPVPSGGFIAYGQINEQNVRKGYVVSMFYSEIRGTVSDFETGAPVVGAHVEVLGTALSTITDHNGSYKVGIANGTYDVTVYGDCISRDTLRGMIVEQDSIARVDFEVLRPLYSRTQSSINAVVQNRVQSSLPFKVVNSGNGSMEIGITTSTVDPSGDWLSVTPDTALILAGDTLTFHVLVSPDTTDDGCFDYLGNLHISSNSCPVSLETIPVMMLVLDADDVPSVIPDDFSLSAYPNPFNSSTTMTFAIPAPARVTLSLFDITGRQVTVLTDQNYSSGSHSILYESGDLPSGIYLAHIISEHFHSTQKIVLIK
ncbi:MAG: carboxypeptidase regulatory-like domain-containing protein [bacterium]|nr:carboxypeptidase regulatory-like domain-containing protein [bacterium]